MAAENLSPAVMHSIAKQIKALVKHPPEGVRYLAEEGTLTEVHCEIAGPETTPFEGGVFHIKLVLGAEYPAAPPKGYFLTKIFHPNISAEGDICVNTLKKDWKADLPLGHVLAVIRCLLIVPFPESSLNEEAGKLFMESFDEFSRRARLMTDIHARRSVSAPTAGAAAGGGGGGGGGGSSGSSSGPSAEDVDSESKTAASASATTTAADDESSAATRSESPSDAASTTGGAARRAGSALADATAASACKAPVPPVASAVPVKAAPASATAAAAAAAAKKKPAAAGGAKRDLNRL